MRADFIRIRLAFMLGAMGAAAIGDAHDNRDARASVEVQADGEKLIRGTAKGDTHDNRDARASVELKADGTNVFRRNGVIDPDHTSNFPGGRFQDNHILLGTSLDECAPNSKWPSPIGADGKGKFDLVISWYTDKTQSSVKSQSTSPVLLESGSRMENNAEIKYGLRSYEKAGLLKHVRDVIILMDPTVLQKYGAPRSFNYARKDIRIVTHTDIGVDNSGCENSCGGHATMLVALHKIPGLSENFLYAPDDIFMFGAFDISAFYDVEAAKPVIHGYGSWKNGPCAGGEGVGSTHGPVFINKCAFEAVAGHYKGYGLFGGHMKGREVPDALCLYSNAMMSKGIFRNDGGDSSFYHECHTNGGCDVNEIPRRMFVNIQGNGVSDEYPDDSGAYSTMTTLFHKEFPKPSRFELAE